MEGNSLIRYTISWLMGYSTINVVAVDVYIVNIVTLEYVRTVISKHRSPRWKKMIRMISKSADLRFDSSIE